MIQAIITGPTGPVGIALMNELIRNQAEVIAVCRKSSERRRRIPVSERVTVIECNLDQLRNLPECIAAAEQTRIRDQDAPNRIFYHLGWDGTFGGSRNQMTDQIRNIQYTMDAVEAAHKLGCAVFIGAGSQAEYGRSEDALNAETPTHPENGYGCAKLCAGQMSRILCDQYGITHLWARILSVYGPFDGEGTMVISTIRKLLAGEIPSLTKGEQIWDYLYTEDAGRALYLMGKTALDNKRMKTKAGAESRIYCVGSGTARPLSEYVKTIRDNIDPSLELGLGEKPYVPGQVMHLLADISKLTEDTGFVPKFSFEEGIRRTIAWCRENDSGIDQ